MDGERYLGNTNKMEVHDLDNEQTGRHECQIDEIIDAGHERPYSSQSAAEDAGFNNCVWCIGL